MKTYGELAAEMDPNDEGFIQFKRGWNAAVHSVRRNGIADPSSCSMAQQAQLWGFFTGQITQPPIASEAVAALDAINGHDPEGAHGEADEVLLAVVPAEVREAYERLAARCGWWATA